MEHSAAYRAYLRALSVYHLRNEIERLNSERREVAARKELAHRLALRDARALIATWQHIDHLMPNGIAAE